MANAQTKASKKYQDKVGLVAKTYKLKKTLVDEFAEKCKEMYSHIQTDFYYDAGIY